MSWEWPSWYGDGDVPNEEDFSFEDADPVAVGGNALPLLGLAVTVALILGGSRLLKGVTRWIFMGVGLTIAVATGVFLGNLLSALGGDYVAKRVIGFFLNWTK